MRSPYGCSEQLRATFSKSTAFCIFGNYFFATTQKINLSKNPAPEFSYR